jgi:hypothetical protein
VIIDWQKVMNRAFIKSDEMNFFVNLILLRRNDRFHQRKQMRPGSLLRRSFQISNCRYRVHDENSQYAIGPSDEVRW